MSQVFCNKVTVRAPSGCDMNGKIKADVLVYVNILKGLNLEHEYVRSLIPITFKTEAGPIRLGSTISTNVPITLDGAAATC